MFRRRHQPYHDGLTLRALPFISSSNAPLLCLIDIVIFSDSGSFHADGCPNYYPVNFTIVFFSIVCKILFVYHFVELIFIIFASKSKSEDYFHAIIIVNYHSHVRVVFKRLQKQSQTVPLHQLHLPTVLDVFSQLVPKYPCCKNRSLRSLSI